MYIPNKSNQNKINNQQFSQQNQVQSVPILKNKSSCKQFNNYVKDQNQIPKVESFTNTCPKMPEKTIIIQETMRSPSCDKENLNKGISIINNNKLLHQYSSPQVYKQSLHTSNNKYQRTMQDMRKNDSQEQFEILKNYDFQFREVNNQNILMGQNISRLYEVQQSHEGLLREISDNLGKFNNQLSILSMDSNSQKNDQSLHIDQIKKQVMQDLNEKFIYKIQIFQENCTNVINNLIKNQINDEFKQQFNKINLKQDQKNFEDQNENYQQKIYTIVNQLENNVEKSENSILKLEKQINAYFNQTKQFENQIQHLLIQVDQKMDKNQIQESSRIPQDCDQKNLDVQNQFESLKEYLAVNIKNNEKQINEFFNRIKSFETFIQNILKEFDKKIKMSSEKLLHQNQETTDLVKKIDNYQSRIEILENSVNQVDSNLCSFKMSQDNQFQEISQNLQSFCNKEQQTQEFVNRIDQNHIQFEQQITKLNQQINNLKSLYEQKNDNQEFFNIIDKKHFQFEQQITKLNQQINNLKFLYDQNNINNKSILTVIEQNKTPNKIIQQTKDQNSKDQDQKKSLISNKFDEYLKKYEDFNKEVSSYLTNRKLPTNMQKQEIEDIILSKSENNLIVNNNQCSEQNPKQLIQNILQQEDQQQIKMCESNIIDKEQEKQEHKKQIFTQQNYGTYLSAISEKEIEEDEIIYQLDDNGYLLDENGQQIVDSQGNPIQLSKEHIEYLKTENMLEDEINK